jgi:hypothetical protein
MLIDRYLPEYDVSLDCQTRVNAPPEQTYRAIREADLRDPVISALFALRELPMRLTRRLRGEPAPPAPRRITLGSITQDGPGWAVLADEPGKGLVIGSVGRFWERDYGGRAVTAEEFVSFREPGYAMLAIAFSLQPDGLGGTLLHYEARTRTTDATAYRKFHRYWALIRPGVALVMRSALHRIKLEAELEVMV